jgi:SAM-dependent methyltransferase
VSAPAVAGATDPPVPAPAGPPVDPLRPARRGRWEDGRVVVRRRPPPAGGPPLHARWSDGRVHLDHQMAVEHLDDDLAGMLQAELASTGITSAHDLFTRLFTGIVVSAADDPLDAWERFYRNTLDRLGASGTLAGPGGSIDRFAPVHHHAVELVRGRSVLEVGCCFGFLSFQLAALGHRVVTSDVCVGTTGLVARMAARLRRPLTPVSCDGAHLPLAPASVDTVVASHVIEHLRPAAGRAVVAEAARVARRRVIVAVPDEPEPAAAFGHDRVVAVAELESLGDRAGWEADVHAWHGRWLVLSRARGARTARPGTPAPPAGGRRASA